MRKLLSFTSGIGAMMLLAGCAALPHAVPSRSYLTPGMQPYATSGACAFLIFTSAPSTEREKRYEHICQAFHRNLQPAQEISHDFANQVITYWLLRSPDCINRQRVVCSELVSNYDYSRGSVLASQVGRQGSAGPLLVAFQNASVGSVPAGDALVLDLSDFADEDLDRAFAIWRDRVTRDPSVWRHGFDLVLFREALRNLIQEYGDGILAVVQAKHN